MPYGVYGAQMIRTTKNYKNKWKSMTKVGTATTTNKKKNILEKQWSGFISVKLFEDLCVVLNLAFVEKAKRTQIHSEKKKKRNHCITFILSHAVIIL